MRLCSRTPTAPPKSYARGFPSCVLQARACLDTRAASMWAGRSAGFSDEAVCRLAAASTQLRPRRAAAPPASCRSIPQHAASACISTPARLAWDITYLHQSARFSGMKIRQRTRIRAGPLHRLHLAGRQRGALHGAERPQAAAAGKAAALRRRGRHRAAAAVPQRVLGLRVLQLAPRRVLDGQFRDHRGAAAQRRLRLQRRGRRRHNGRARSRGDAAAGLAAVAAALRA